MNVVVEFYNFAKRINSTKIPFEQGAYYNCKIKDNCSIVSPEIEIGQHDIDNPALYNYCRIGQWNRFYFVKWNYTNGIWNASLSCDTLASNRAYIMATRQYVLRDAKEGKFDGNVPDNYYPIKVGPCLITESYGTKPWVDDISSGTYVLGVLGNNYGESRGAINYIAMSQEQFSGLMEKLFEPSFYIHNPGSGDWSDKEIDTFKAQFNPMQYIVSCMWFPFKFTQGIMASPLHLGWYDIDALYTVGVHNFSFTSVFGIPRHPQAEGEGLYPGTGYAGETRGVWLDVAPYSQYVLDFKPFGQMQFDGTQFIGKENLHANGVVDMITGEAVLTVSVQRDPDDPFYPGTAVIATRRGRVGVNMAVAQVAKDYVAEGVSLVKGTANGLAMLGSTLLSSAPVISTLGIVSAAKSAGNLAADVGNFIDNMYPRADIQGHNGTTVDFTFTPRLIGTFHYIVPENNEHVGRPLCKEMTLSDLMPGFIKCAEADIDLPVTDDEIKAVQGFMLDGFFLE